MAALSTAQQHAASTYPGIQHWDTTDPSVTPLPAVENCTGFGADGRSNVDIAFSNRYNL